MSLNSKNISIPQVIQPLKKCKSDHVTSLILMASHCFKDKDQDPKILSMSWKLAYKFLHGSSSLLPNLTQLLKLTHLHSLFLNEWKCPLLHMLFFLPDLLSLFLPLPPVTYYLFFMSHFKYHFFRKAFVELSGQITLLKKPKFFLPSTCHILVKK